MQRLVHPSQPFTTQCPSSPRPCRCGEIISPNCTMIRAILLAMQVSISYIRIVKEEGVHAITRAQLKEWLSQQETYTLHRGSRRRGPKLRVISPFPGYMWDCDLADLSGLSKFNKGARYFLLAIDAFSRYVWTRQLKSKSGKEVTEAFQSIFEEGKKPLKLRHDRGKRVPQ